MATVVKPKSFKEEHPLGEEGVERGPSTRVSRPSRIPSQRSVKPRQGGSKRSTPTEFRCVPLSSLSCGEAV